ncbi:MAG: DUF1868 domain-containing protein [Cyanobacteriota bacterium]|nr:DUF1868 domain-containing protein [Cyanobacteriota bacterium]
MDDSYPVYLNRVARLTRRATLHSQLANIQSSPKFEDGRAVAFPGYSAIAPLWEGSSEILALRDRLTQLQQSLVEQMDGGLMVPVAPESFHLTLTDLLWDEAYREAIEKNPAFEEQLRDRVAQCFEQSAPQLSSNTPIQIQSLGLLLRPRAIMVGVVPQSEQGYSRILQLRRAIYQNAGLIGLGIEQQYDFTGHITLGYFDKISSDLDRDRLVSILDSINDNWLETEMPSTSIEGVWLYKFDDMNHFYREPDWPGLRF